MGLERRHSGHPADEERARWEVRREAAGPVLTFGPLGGALHHAAGMQGPRGPAHQRQHPSRTPLAAPHPQKEAWALAWHSCGPCSVAPPGALDGILESPGCPRAPGGTPRLQDPQEAPHALKG